MKMTRKMLGLAVPLAMLAGLCHAGTLSPRRLLEVTDLTNPVVSPDSRKVAFRSEQASVERNTYDTVWYVQGLDGKSQPLRISDGGVTLRDTAGISLPAPAVWSPDGRWIYYRALLDGRVDVWRAATDGSGAQPVTLDAADVRNFSLSADGKTLRYSVGATREEVIAAEQAEYDHGIRLEETVPVGQGLFRSGNIEGRLATQRYTRLGVDRAALLADVPDRWKVVDLMRGSIRNALSSEIPPEPARETDLNRPALPEDTTAATNPGDGRIALLTPTGDRAGFIYKPSVKLSVLSNVRDGRPVECHTELCTDKDITGIQWRPGTDEVLFTVTDRNEGRAQSIFRWDVKTGVVRVVVSSKGQLSGSRDPHSSCGLSSKVLVCVTAEAAKPPRLERVDLESGERSILFDPNAAFAQELAQHTQVELLRWTDAGGRSYTGQYFRARKTGRAAPPLFVVYYSCSGFLRGGTGDEWPLATLAEDGISAVCINNAPIRLDAVERYDQGRFAVAGVVDLLASRGEIDRTKVGMGGLSYGTEVTLWTLMNSDLLAAASVASVGMSSTYYVLQSIEGERMDDSLRTIWQLGTPEETPERWKVLSPQYNLGKFKAPILMQMPEQEYLCTLDYTIPLMKRGQADAYVFPNEPHQKFQPKHKLAVYERNVDWFRFWLQGYEDPDPIKAKQYENWGLMRSKQSSWAEK